MEITISRLKEIIKEEIGSHKNNTLLETPAHFCASHVRENTTGRTGRCVSHNWNETLQEVTTYDVNFGNTIVKNVPVSELTILEAHLPENHGGHMAKRDTDSEPVYEEVIELDEEVEELEEIAAKRFGNEDRDQGRNRMHPDRLHEEELDEVDITKNLDPKDRGPVDQTENPDLSKKATQKAADEAAKKSIEETVAFQVDSLLIEMGLMQPRKPLTLEEQVASIVDSYLPKLNEKELEDTTFAYEKEEVVETKNLGDTIREAVEEAVKSVVESNPVDPVVEGEDKYSRPKDMPGGKIGGEAPKTPKRGPEEKVEETEIKTSIKEWYNSEKFEALKNKWAK